MRIIIVQVDLSMEKQVIDQANLRRQAIAGEATSPHDSLRGGITGGIPMIPYQNSTILTPVPAPNDTLTTGGDTQPVSESPTPIDKPLGEMSLRDFEGESDPFEVTALQAIDVYTELQSVLQPHQTSNTGTTVPSDVSSSVAPPSGYLSQSAPSQTLYTGSPGPLPPPGPVYETIGSRGSDVGVLVDVGGRPQEVRLNVFNSFILIIIIIISLYQQLDLLYSILLFLPLLLFLLLLFLLNLLQGQVHIPLILHIVLLLVYLYSHLLVSYHSNKLLLLTLQNPVVMPLPLRHTACLI